MLKSVKIIRPGRKGISANELVKSPPNDEIQEAIKALLKKLDLDTGVTDTDYEQTVKI